MTNAELIEELEAARAERDACEAIFLKADDDGTLTEEIERQLMEAEEDVRQLSLEGQYRANWEPRPKAW
jgi:hypothetical protein